MQRIENIGAKRKSSPETSSSEAEDLAQELGKLNIDRKILPTPSVTDAINEREREKSENTKITKLEVTIRANMAANKEQSGHLTALTRKDSTWTGGKLPKEAQDAFDKLKGLLTKEPLIAYARNNLPFELYMDDSTGMTEVNGTKIAGRLEKLSEKYKTEEAKADQDKTKDKENSNYRSENIGICPSKSTKRKKVPTSLNLLKTSNFMSFCNFIGRKGVL